MSQYASENQPKITSSLTLHLCTAIDSYITVKNKINVLLYKKMIVLIKQKKKKDKYVKQK